MTALRQSAIRGLERSICQVRAVTKKGAVKDYDRELDSYRDEKYGK